MLDKAVTLLDAILADGGQSPLGMIAAQTGLPQTTAYRLAAALIRQELLIAEPRGRYLPGPRLIRYAREIDPTDVLRRIAIAPVAALATRFRQVAHLGILDGGMVTYLIKTGRGEAGAFARQGMQLEAYCSGVGKVLLAHLSEPALNDYLANGPFIRLTANTIVEPKALRRHLQDVRRDGIAIDDEEIAIGLRCVAVPVRGQNNEARAAISLSAPAAWLDGDRIAETRIALETAARHIETRLFPGRGTGARQSPLGS